MPATLRNPSARRTPKNYSIEVRVQDIVQEIAHRDSLTESEVVNQLLKEKLGVVN